MTWKKYFGAHFRIYSQILHLSIWIFILLTWTFNSSFLNRPVLTVALAFVAVCMTVVKLREVLPPSRDRYPIALVFWLGLGIINLVSLLALFNLRVESIYKILIVFVTIGLLAFLTLTVSLFAYDSSYLTKRAR